MTARVNYSTRFLRRAWLAALPLWVCACVVPMAPQFEDPPGNLPPYLVSSVPVAGAELRASTDPTDTIEATLGDPNLDDILWVRWLIDYPPYDALLSHVAQQVILPTTGAVERETIHFAASCSDNHIASGLASHRVTLSVADRPFLPAQEAPPDLLLDSVPVQGFVVRATWFADCP